MALRDALKTRTAVALSVAWGVTLGGTFACILPYLFGDWHVHRPLPYWQIAQGAGCLLILTGTIPVVQSFVEFVRAGGTPVPPASPPRLVVAGFYRHVRNPIYVGYVAVLLGEALLFGSRGLLVYTALSWCVGAMAVRFYEEPVLKRRFGRDYEEYLHHVRAWLPRLHPWVAVCSDKDDP